MPPFNIIFKRTLFLIVFISVTSFGQQSYIDSLERVGKNKKLPDSTRVQSLLEITKTIRLEDHEKAISTAQDALRLAKSTNYSLGITNTYKEIAYTYGVLGDNNKALEYFFKQLKSYENLPEKTPGKGNCLANIGKMYGQKKEFDKAIKFKKRAIQEYEKINDIRRIGRANNSIGSSYIEQLRMDEAKPYIEKALEIALQMDFPLDVADAKQNLANCFYDTDYDGFLRAQQLNKEVLEIYKSQGDQYGICLSNYNLAANYINQNEDSKAIPYLLSTIRSAHDAKLGNEEMDAHKLLSNTYEKVGSFQEALVHLQVADSLENQIQSEAQLRIVSELETKYETEKREQENEILKRDNTLKRKDAQLKTRTIYAISIGSILVLLIVLLWFKRFRQQKEVREQKLLLQLEKQSHEIDNLRAAISARLNHPNDETSIESNFQNLNNYLVNPLSERELEVLVELKEGKTNKEIADSLNLSINTIKTHLLSLYVKLDVKNRTQAVQRATSISNEN